VYRFVRNAQKQALTGKQEKIAGEKSKIVFQEKINAKQQARRREFSLRMHFRKPKYASRNRKMKVFQIFLQFFGEIRPNQACRTKKGRFFTGK